MYRIHTYRFVSLLNTWSCAISANIDRFYALLNSIPAPHNNRFEVVGVIRGYDGVEYMAPYKVVGYGGSVESNQALLEGAMHKIYPNAEVTFRTVLDIKEL